jgi:hypothetical protein
MKKIQIITSVYVVSVLFFTNCNKQIEGRTDNAPMLFPIDMDVDAGSWQTILLGRPDSFPVAVPAATNSTAYIAELNEIKGLQKRLTKEQKATIQYWNAGSVLRWNEIMRELVARHNLPPYENEDGTYPIPSSTNPFNYPEFPFSNPPYAARAYAYVAAAQYDALVACWYYRYLYNRAAPYTADSLIQAQSLCAKVNAPSYPSAEAVVAGVTVEMMKLLFPTEIGYIQQKADEANFSRIASGGNLRSDVDAGMALGKQVAQVFTARAKLDRAGSAVGTPEQWAVLESECTARGEIPWESMEVPQRPPMLPFFGNVTPFLFDSVTAKQLSAGTPPSTTSNVFKDELAFTKERCANASRQEIATVHFWADGAGTYTPPGHWNVIAADDFITAKFSEVRWARNMALLNVSMMDAAIVCWQSKYTFYTPRPSQLDGDINTLTGLPNFPAYISGHSTFSAAAADILGHILPINKNKYAEMAKEASLSRILGGLHYRMDCDSGLAVGSRIASFAIQRAKTDGAD